MARKPAKRPAWFKTGNAVALRHGARSPRTYQPLADELAAMLLTERADLEPYRYEVRAWAIAETRAELLRLHLDSVGLVDPQTGEPRMGLLDSIARHESAAAKSRIALGLTPATHATLLKDRADATKSVRGIEELVRVGEEVDRRMRELPQGADDVDA